MTFKKINFILVGSLLFIASLNATEQIKIVGSSTVYPFSSSVAEELSVTKKIQTPVVESTGTGGGIKLFCSGNDLNTPDIVNASRRMKTSEFELCQKNQVKNITEALIGFDGIVIAQSSKIKPFNVTKKQLALAVAQEVPAKDGKTLIKNPYKKWSDIDPSLPDREIIIYGPSKASGTRDTFEEMVLKNVFEKMDIYTNLYKKDNKISKQYESYSTIRSDGAYVDSGENYNLVVQKLTKNENAIGIFGYSYLIENEDKVIGLTIENVSPSVETISNGSYALARSMYFYIKNDHLSKVKPLNDYINLFMSEQMIGEDGILTEIGLIPLESSVMKKEIKKVKNKEKLTLKDLQH